MITIIEFLTFLWYTIGYINMLDHKKISIIFPCKNEEKIIGSILSKIPKFIDQIIVVDNRSTDKTYFVAKKNKAEVYKENRHIKGIGYGYAIQTGIKKAHGDYIILMDGDKTYSMKYIRKIINYMEKQRVGFVSCNRFPLSDWKNMSPVRYLGGLFLTKLANILFNLKIKDILSGMWIFRKDIIPYLNLEPGDWNLSISIKISAALNPKIKFHEYHIYYHDRKFGNSKQSLINTGFSHLKFLLKLKYYQLLKPVYQTKRIFRLNI